MNQAINYRHAFHAGNFADVHKHAALVLLLQSMVHKDNPFSYLETHAGAGRYDLHAPDAERTREWEAGIGRLWARSMTKLSPHTLPYFALVTALNPNGHLRHYPGSPLLARSCLRPMDRMVLLEACFAAAQRLEKALGTDKKNDQCEPGRIHVRVGDGYAALKPWLPPLEKRGVIFIDPPFERRDEFRQILTALATIHQLFATGTVAVWYPLKDRNAIARFHHSLEKSGLRRLLLMELRVLPEDVNGRFHGSAWLLHNPPWQMDQKLVALGEELAILLATGPRTGSEVRWLVRE